MNNPIIFIPFLVVMVLFALLYSAGKKKYAAYLPPLDKDVYGLKDFFPVGFVLMDLLHYNYGSNLDRTLRRQLTELYTAEFSEFYLRVTWAQAATSALVGLLLGTLFFGAMEGDISMLVLGVGFAAVLVWASFDDVKKRVQKRHDRVAVELPELTNQLLILSGAGLTLKGAMVKVAREMSTDGPLYQALGKSVEMMELGATNEQALDNLTSACNTPEVRRFVSVLLQNLQRGGTDVFLALGEIGKELWDARRAAAKRVAEETTTKLLFPMMLMLFAVILLVAVPAVMSMTNM